MKPNRGERFVIASGKASSCPECGHKMNIHDYKSGTYVEETQTFYITCPICGTRTSDEERDILNDHPIE